MITRGGDPNQAVADAASDRALTSEESAALRTEITTDPTGRGYSGATADTLYKFCAPYTAPNPTPQGTVPRDYWDSDVLQNALLQMPSGTPGVCVLLAIHEAADNATDPAAKAVAKTVVLALSSQIKGLNLQNANVQAMLAALVTTGIATQAQVDYITQQPDPAWTATVTMPSRAEVVLGNARLVPTMRDLAEALA